MYCRVDWRLKASDGRELCFLFCLLKRAKLREYSNVRNVFERKGGKQTEVFGVLEGDAYGHLFVVYEVFLLFWIVYCAIDSCSLDA